MRFKRKSFKTPFGKVVLAEVTLKHAKALNRIVNEAGVNEFLLVEPPVSLSATIAKIKDKKRYAVWMVVELNGEPVGSIHLKPSYGRAKHVSNFGISFSKKVHGTGIPVIALNEIFSFARKHGIEILSSACAEDNFRGRKFYKKMGFKEVGRLKDHLKRKGEYLDDLLIVKRL